MAGMTSIRPCYILAVAALISVGTASHAEDLPVAGAPALDLNQALCSIYGAGFHAVPGTDTCVRVGGSVRVDGTYVGGDLGSDFPNTSTVTRGRARFESRTQTDFGQVRIVIDKDFDLDSADR
jgi:hypothetical protein